MKQLIMTHDVAIYYKKCNVTGKHYSVAISLKQYEQLQSPNRENIQDILPEYTNDEREFLISGITPDEWDSMFNEGVGDEDTIAQQIADSREL